LPQTSLFRAIPIMPQATQSSKCSLQLIQYNEGDALGWMNHGPSARQSSTSRHRREGPELCVLEIRPRVEQLLLGSVTSLSCVSCLSWFPVRSTGVPFHILTSLSKSAPRPRNWKTTALMTNNFHAGKPARELDVTGSNSWRDCVAGSVVDGLGSSALA
jgi:hypothetical protein